MRRRKRDPGERSLLDLWRPPTTAGVPIGCLTTTFTFDAEHFDHHCLGQFLGLENDADREGLPYLVERETELAKVYAGVLVDRHHAKGSHSLRWDLLSVRVPGGIQHAKVSLLCWEHSVRILIGSANLTEPGYRQNRELVTAVDSTKDGAHHALVGEVVKFLKTVLKFTPQGDGASGPKERAEQFLKQVTQIVRVWPGARAMPGLSVAFAPTLPTAKRSVARSSWQQALEEATRSNRKLQRIAIASPFFDQGDASGFVETVYGALHRSGDRVVELAAPVQVEEAAEVARLAAPSAFLRVAEEGDIALAVYQLPAVDQHGNRRPWHAKALVLESDSRTVLLTGSANCTLAGLGINRANIEAGLLYTIDRSRHDLPVDLTEVMWGANRRVKRLADAEWIGSGVEPGDEDSEAVLPEGFALALYEGGDAPLLSLTFVIKHLPNEWRVVGIGRAEHLLVEPVALGGSDGQITISIPWPEEYPPQELRVVWSGDQVAEWPFNVRDPGSLPPMLHLRDMSADDLLRVLAAADPKAALRAWARATLTGVSGFEPDEDSAIPVDLNPLRRYDIGDTFLHRVRRRARLLAQYQRVLGRAVRSKPALVSRLSGPVGVNLLLDRTLAEISTEPDGPDGALLRIADTMITLSGVRYEAEPGALTVKQFESIYRPFVAEAATRIGGRMQDVRDRASPDVAAFFESVLRKCTEVG